jgi:galactokinase/mevalonate kinase-like predicted kinase
LSLIESSAPGRFGVVGNPSDMYSGSVISCSTSERANCTLETGADRVTISLGGQVEDLRTNDDLVLDGGPLDLPKAALTSLGIDPADVAPFHLSAETDIPRQSGLAGSTALFAAILGALLEHAGRRAHRYEIAEMVRAAEFDVMKTLCGFQDAYMVVFGGLHFMDFRRKTVRDNDALTSAYATMESLSEYVPCGLPIVIAFSGVMHHSGQTHASLYERYLAGDPAANSAAETFATYARLGKRAILSQDWASLAEFMTLNQKLIRAVQPQNPANEKLIEAALSAGAMAAKLAGAGGGGSIAALTVDPKGVAQALTDAGAAAVLTPAIGPGLTVRRLG